MKIFVLTDNVRAFFTDNKFLNPNDVKVIHDENALMGVDKGLILYAKYDYRNRKFEALQDEILRNASLRNINMVDLRK